MNESSFGMLIAGSPGSGAFSLQGKAVKKKEAFEGFDELLWVNLENIPVEEELKPADTLFYGPAYTLFFQQQPDLDLNEAEQRLVTAAIESEGKTVKIDYETGDLTTNIGIETDAMKENTLVFNVNRGTADERPDMESEFFPVFEKVTASDENTGKVVQGATVEVESQKPAVQIEKADIPKKTDEHISLDMEINKTEVEQRHVKTPGRLQWNRGDVSANEKMVVQKASFEKNEGGLENGLFEFGMRLKMQEGKQEVSNDFSSRVDVLRQVEEGIPVQAEKIVMGSGAERTLTINLKPDNLGAIKIRLETTEKGCVASIYAQKDEVRRMLSESVSDLSKLLDKVGNVERIIIEPLGDNINWDASYERGGDGGFQREFQGGFQEGRQQRERMASLGVPVATGDEGNNVRQRAKEGFLSVYA